MDLCIYTVSKYIPIIIIKFDYYIFHLPRQSNYIKKYCPNPSCKKVLQGVSQRNNYNNWLYLLSCLKIIHETKFLADYIIIVFPGLFFVYIPFPAHFFIVLITCMQSESSKPSCKDYIPTYSI